MDEPKTWTPPQGAGSGAGAGAGAARPPVAGWQRIAMGVAGLAVVAFGVMQMSSGLGMLTGGANSFDPAKPPALGDPAPGIVKHLEGMARGETVAPETQANIERFVVEARATLPGKLDEVTTMVGAYSAGRHIGLDSRIMLTQPVADLKVFRERLRAQLPAILTEKLCTGNGGATAQFLKQQNATLTHAYTVNDGKETIFIDLAPTTCDGWRPAQTP